MQKILTIMLAMMLTACALPETKVTTGSSRPSLAVKGAPADTTLYVDGLAIGAAADFDGAPKVLVVEEGAHQVEIRRNNAVVHKEKIFVGSGETRTVTVNAGAN